MGVDELDRPRRRRRRALEAQPLDDCWADGVVSAEGVAVTDDERMNRQSPDLPYRGLLYQQAHPL